MPLHILVPLSRPPSPAPYGAFSGWSLSHLETFICCHQAPFISKPLCEALPSCPRENKGSLHHPFIYFSPRVCPSQIFKITCLPVSLLTNLSYLSKRKDDVIFSLRSPPVPSPVVRIHPILIIEYLGECLINYNSNYFSQEEKAPRKAPDCYSSCGFLPAAPAFTHPRTGGSPHRGRGRIAGSGEVTPIPNQRICLLSVSESRLPGEPDSSLCAQYSTSQ